MADNEGMKADVKVSILLQEYQGLRREVLARTSNMYQLIIGCAAEIAWITQWCHEKTVAVPFLFVAFLIIGGTAYLFFLIGRDIDKAARRLRELEADINCRAGEELLAWESRYGGAVTSYYGRGTPLKRVDV